jgi:hypothetical protein
VLQTGWDVTVDLEIPDRIARLGVAPTPHSQKIGLRVGSEGVGHGGSGVEGWESRKTPGNSDIYLTAILLLIGKEKQ